MLLYHYSKERFNELRTKENRGESTPNTFKNNGVIGSYDQHISFFLDPIPTSIMGKIYGKEHHTWYPGNELYQYEIESKDIGDFTYSIVETPEKLELYYDDSVSEKQYQERYSKIVSDLKLIGHNNKDLEIACKRYIGKTRSCIEKVKDLPNWNDLKNKYAAGVTHLMLYPTDGVIKYLNYDKVKIK